MINTLNHFVQACATSLGSALSGVLYYGSSARATNSRFSDQDILLTARQHDLGFIQSLGKILRQVTIEMDLSVVFESELPTNPDHFRIINHGCYFLEVMKESTVLYGKNIFLDLPPASELAIRLSLFEKVAEYTQYLRRSFFLEARGQKTPQANHHLNRRVVKAAHDLLWLLGDRQDNGLLVVLRLAKAIPDMLQGHEWEFLAQLADPEHADTTSGDLTDAFSETRLLVMEAIYTTSRRITFPSPLPD